MKSDPVPETYDDDAINWSFGNPLLIDSLGDRIMNIEIEDMGVFDSNRIIGEVMLTFDDSLRPDVDKDGVRDFIPATATAHSSFRLTHFELDQNASFEHGGRNRSLFVEEPVVNILPQLSLQVPSPFLQEDKTDFFRLDGLVGYDPNSNLNYFDLHVDNRLPTKFYYGFGSDADGLPAMGGSITVTDAMPVLSWGQNEPNERNMTAYTDQNGYYFIPNLDPGLYNVGVFLEDRKFQDSTFRPDSNLSRVSDVLYVPGFSDLSLEADGRGAGVSRLVWSEESRIRSRPDSSITNELKILEGIGGGFRLGESPELVLLPEPGNSNDILPNIIATGLKDGTLKLEIIDDENTTAYSPGDRFIVRYSSNVQGVDFKEYYLFSESDKSSWGGYLDSDVKSSSWLKIFPNDSNGTGVLEVPLSTEQTGDVPFTFNALAYDGDGNQLDTSTVTWSLSLPFDPPENNVSLVAELNQTLGSEVALSLSSSLRNSGIVGFEILSAGTGYAGGADSEILISGDGTGFVGELVVNEDGNVTDVIILNSGRGYGYTDRITVRDVNESSSANSARLSPILGGNLILHAELVTGQQTLYAHTQVFASTRNKLTSTEEWLDYYFDSIQSLDKPGRSGWNGDQDSDGLTNAEEKIFGTNPLMDDTDGDALLDSLEIHYETNPHQKDTDGDGLSDYEETDGDDYNNTVATFPDGTDPRKSDTDKDGIDDGFEVRYASELSGLNPLVPNTAGKTLGGYVFNLDEYEGQLYVKVEPIFDANEPCEVEENASVVWKALGGTYPALYSFENLPTGYTYRISAFIDSFPAGSPNESYDKGEPSACWQGFLSGNKFSANLFLQEDPPEIYFNDPADVEITLSDLDDEFYKFPISVLAWDLLHGEWDANTSSPEITITPDTKLDTFLEIDRNNLLGKIQDSIDLGSYSIAYQAIDLTGSKSQVLTQKINIVDNQGPNLTLIGENPLSLSLWINLDRTRLDSFGQSR